MVRSYRLRAAELTSVQSGDELVALDLRRSRYLSTNASGRRLWSLLERGATADELAATLRDAYGLTAEDASRDASAYLAELDAAGLLETVDAG